MNFNMQNNEYSLQANMTDELINLYGILVKIAITEKINSDKNVFGDFSHIKTNTSKTFSVYAMPETSESFDSTGINFSGFGLTSLETTNIFISRKSIDTIFPEPNMGGNFDSGKGFEGIVGSIVTLPSGKLMEITEIQFEVPGTNNLFTQANVKNVYKLSLSPYSYKENDEIVDSTVNSADTEDDDYASLTNYFDELTNTKEEVQVEAETVVKPNSQLDSVFDRF